ncbi:condensation domain-containing protein [Nocardia sputorum]|uniref:Conserved polyketide synthase associated protein PapA2 n=1 Tax=Nocardia sputorum TaxID=2984338 RepID=A0ABM8D2V7_9NOCA|nr:condensation domain-containing protein [Nocardia sputorum]BDU01633.1 putative conserved polyketide synthase associated protein PapA2 [Nocardia sputorum]
MVNFGFIDEWQPTAGRLTSWRAAPESLAAARRAPAHPAPPSHQQEEYLRTAHRTADAGFRVSRVCMIAFTIPGVPDRAALTRAIEAFLRRHDTFWSWFVSTAADEVERRVLDPADIRVVPTEHGVYTDSDAIRAHVLAETPGPLEWDCFSFGIIEHAESFTVYAAVDHLHTDGVAQALSCVDLLTLYGSELSGRTLTPAPVTGHIAYCERERRLSAELTAESPQISVWLDLLRRNGGDVPGFPVDLWAAGDEHIRGAQVTTDLIDEPGALRFEEVCRANGGRFTGGLFAAAALAEIELAGGDWYFGLTPVNTRRTEGEAASVGWYTNLIPVAFPVRADQSFTGVVAAAQAAYDRGKELTDVSLHRALQLAPPELGIRTRPGWSARMLSYLDIRKMAGVEMFDKIDGGMFANRGSSREVYIWINRFTDVTTLSLLFPDTPRAHEVIARYVTAVRAIVADVAAKGDRAVRAGALP